MSSSDSALCIYADNLKSHFSLIVPKEKLFKTKIPKPERYVRGPCPPFGGKTRANYLQRARPVILKHICYHLSRPSRPGYLLKKKKINK